MVRMVFNSDERGPFFARAHGIHFQADSVQGVFDAIDTFEAERGLTPASYIVDRVGGMTPADEIAKLRADAKALDTGMDPELVREIHAQADALEAKLQEQA